MHDVRYTLTTRSRPSKQTKKVLQRNTRPWSFWTTSRNRVFEVLKMLRRKRKTFPEGPPTDVRCHILYAMYCALHTTMLYMLCFIPCTIYNTPHSTQLRVHRAHCMLYTTRCTLYYLRSTTLCTMYDIRSQHEVGLASKQNKFCKETRARGRPGQPYEIECLRCLRCFGDKGNLFRMDR